MRDDDVPTTTDRGHRRRCRPMTPNDGGDSPRPPSRWSSGRPPAPPAAARVSRLPVRRCRALAVSGVLGWQLWQEHQIAPGLGERPSGRRSPTPRCSPASTPTRSTRTSTGVLDGATGEFKDMYSQSSVRAAPAADRQQGDRARCRRRVGGAVGVEEQGRRAAVRRPVGVQHRSFPIRASTAAGSR